MGWYYNNIKQTKKEFVTSLINEIKREEQQNQYLQLRLDSHSLRGQELWLCYIDKKDKTSYIVLYKLSCYQGEWGYKPINETMGPYSHSLPPKYMLKYPCCVKDNKYSLDFRRTVLNTKTIKEQITTTAKDIDKYMYKG